MIIYGLDPGSKKSALVGIDADTLEIEMKMLEDNEIVKQELSDISSYEIPVVLAIEFIQSYGMVVGQSTFMTCLWVGRFIETWGENHKCYLYARPTIKSIVAGMARAKDSNIRQALILRLGDWKKGGPLEGIKKDMWSALAVAIAHIEKAPKLEW